MKISIVFNCDSRNENNEFGGSNLTGVSCEDMIVDSLLNKIKFFDGFDIEVICYLDRHNFIADEILKKLQGLCDVLVVRKHTDEVNFNDWNYVRALQLATGDIICKVDQDTASFSKDEFVVYDLIKLLEEYDFISYPSHWSPIAVTDTTFDHVWCSTRWFMCKRESLDLDEIKKCFDYDYWINTYPVNRKCHWLEHWIGSIAKYKNQKVFYPPMNNEKYLIWSWGKYKKGLLKELNNSTYEQVKEFINNHPITYPNDVNA